MRFGYRNLITEALQEYSLASRIAVTATSQCLFNLMSKSELAVSAVGVVTYPVTASHGPFPRRKSSMLLDHA